MCTMYAIISYVYMGSLMLSYSRIHCRSTTSRSPQDRSAQCSNGKHARVYRFVRYGGRTLIRSSIAISRENTHKWNAKADQEVEEEVYIHSFSSFSSTSIHSHTNTLSFVYDVCMYIYLCINQTLFGVSCCCRFCSTRARALDRINVREMHGNQKRSFQGLSGFRVASRHEGKVYTFPFKYGHAFSFIWFVALSLSDIAAFCVVYVVDMMGNYLHMRPNKRVHSCACMIYAVNWSVMWWRWRRLGDGWAWVEEKNEIGKMGARARVSLAFDTREEVRDHIGTEWKEEGEEKNSGLLAAVECT